jgi:hypothetical protein
MAMKQLTSRLPSVLSVSLLLMGPMELSLADEPSRDDMVVCKTQRVTGSRLRKTPVCRTVADWRREREAGQEFMKNVDKANAPGPGGDSLPNGK